MAIVLIILGLVLLAVGAEVLLRGAVGLARAVGMPSLIIGLTVVALGTSAPEFAVSIKAGYMGQTDIALGNVVGSNTLNILLVLGLAAVIAPVKARGQVVRMDVPMMIGFTALVWLLAANGTLGRIEGILLCLSLIGYTSLLIYLGKRKKKKPPVEIALGEPPKTMGGIHIFLSILWIAVGLAMLVFGARWLVDGASEVARALGVSDLMIGLTVVALGTSMPEVATTVVAGFRAQRDIAIGNVVGSNMFNMLGVLGLTAIMAPQGMDIAPAALRFDIPVMFAASLACLPILFTGGRISRGEGALFLGYYVAYVVFLMLSALQHHSLGIYSFAMFWFVIPLSAIGILVSVVLYIRQLRNGRQETIGPG